ncbi:MAG: hypothetical protein AVDCRST_MAG35-3144, partial [uncultured Quadrisphaera sp.]
ERRGRGSAGAARRCWAGRGTRRGRPAGGAPADDDPAAGGGDAAAGVVRRLLRHHRRQPADHDPRRAVGGRRLRRGQRPGGGVPAGQRPGAAPVGRGPGHRPAGGAGLAGVRGDLDVPRRAAVRGAVGVAGVDRPEGRPRPSPLGRRPGLRRHGAPV